MTPLQRAKINYDHRLEIADQQYRKAIGEAMVEAARNHNNAKADAWELFIKESGQEGDER